MLVTTNKSVVQIYQQGEAEVNKKLIDLLQQFIPIPAISYSCWKPASMVVAGVLQYHMGVRITYRKR